MFSGVFFVVDANNLDKKFTGCLVATSGLLFIGERSCSGDESIFVSISGDIIFFLLDTGDFFADLNDKEGDDSIFDNDLDFLTDVLVVLAISGSFLLNPKTLFEKPSSCAFDILVDDI
jgi:hypothetical protein